MADPVLRGQALATTTSSWTKGKTCTPATGGCSWVVAPGSDDLIICEDDHQWIYGERTVLTRFGIETRDPSGRLTPELPHL